MNYKNIIENRCILVLCDSYSNLSIDSIDKKKLFFVDKFSNSSVEDIVNNLKFLFEVSENCKDLAFVIINEPDSTFLYKVAI